MTDGLFEVPSATSPVVDPERLARALFIHVCPPAQFDAASSWDTGKAARQSWIAMARRVIAEMGWADADPA